jgi:hypothetical protein
VVCGVNAGNLGYRVHAIEATALRQSAVNEKTKRHYGFRRGSHFPALRRFRLEYPRPHAEWRNRVPNPATEKPTMIPKIRSVLEKNPWYETRWKAQLEKLQIQKQDEMLFMLAHALGG